MLLKPVEKHSCHPGLIATLAILDKEPVDVASDYLQKLWEHATRVIKSKIGEALFDSLQIKVVLTVPAIWDHQGQDMTRRAADRAGITKGENTTLKLVSEPEAAALAVLKDNRSLKVCAFMKTIALFIANAISIRQVTLLLSAMLVVLKRVSFSPNLIHLLLTLPPHTVALRNKPFSLTMFLCKHSWIT